MTTQLTFDFSSKPEDELIDILIEAGKGIKTHITSFKKQVAYGMEKFVLRIERFYADGKTYKEDHWWDNMDEIQKDVKIWKKFATDSSW